MSDRGIIDDGTMRLRQPPPCPAAEEIADIRGSRLPNTPGVLCRVTWDVQSPDTNPRVLVKWCCNARGGDGGYTDCPVWQFDKRRIEEGRKSFGDQREQEDQDVRTWRDDLTGSEYGDTSFMEPIEQSVDATIEHMKERGESSIEGRTGVDLDP